MGGLLEEAHRKEWGTSPVGRVLRVLQEAELQPLSQKMESDIMHEDGAGWLFYLLYSVPSFPLGETTS